MLYGWRKPRVNGQPFNDGIRSPLMKAARNRLQFRSASVRPDGSPRRNSALLERGAGLDVNKQAGLPRGIADSRAVRSEGNALGREVGTGWSRTESSQIPKQLDTVVPKLHRSGAVSAERTCPARRRADGLEQPDISKVLDEQPQRAPLRNSLLSHSDIIKIV